MGKLGWDGPCQFDDPNNKSTRGAEMICQSPFLNLFAM